MIANDWRILVSAYLNPERSLKVIKIYETVKEEENTEVCEEELGEGIIERND